MYDNFDKAHRRDHVDMVITQSMKLAGNVEEINFITMRISHIKE